MSITSALLLLISIGQEALSPAAFRPDGPLPQHRARVLSADDSLIGLGVTRSGLVWADHERVYRSRGEGEELLWSGGESLAGLAVHPDGLAAVTNRRSKDKTDVVLLGRDDPETIQAPADANGVTWCGERLVVSGSAVMAVRDGRAEPLVPVAGLASPKSCGGGRLALIVAGGIRVVDLGTAKVGPVLAARGATRDRPMQAAMSASGTHVAAAGEFGELWLWDARSFELLQRRPGAYGQRGDLAFSPDGTQLAAGMSRLSVPDLQLIDRWKRYGNHASWSPGGDRLVIGAGDWMLSLDLAGRARTPMPRGATATPRSMVLVGGERPRLAVADERGWVSLWRLGPLEVVGGFDLGVDGDFTRGLVAMPDGTLLGRAWSALQRYALDGRRLEHRDLPHPFGESIAVDTRGRLVAATSSNHVHLLDWESGKVLFTKGPYKAPGETFDGSAVTVDLHPSGDLLLAAGRAKTHLLSTKDGAEVAALPRRGEPAANRAAFTPSGTHIVATAWQSVWLYGWPGLAATELPYEASYVDHASFTRDGGTAVLSNWGGALRAVALEPKPRVIWEARSKWHTGAHVLDEARGRVLASGPALRLEAFDLKTGAPLPAARAGAGPRFEALALSPDGRYLATAQYHGTVALWDLREGRRVARWQDPDGEAPPLLAVTNEGALTAVGGRAVRHWSRPGAELKQVQVGEINLDGGVSADGTVALLVDPGAKSVVAVDVPSGEVERKKMPKRLVAAQGSLSPDGRHWLGFEPYADRPTAAMTDLRSGRTKRVSQKAGLSLLGWTDGAAHLLEAGDEPRILRWTPGRMPKPLKTAGSRFVRGGPSALSAHRLVTASRGALVVLRLPDLSLERALPVSEAQTVGMAITPDGRRLAVGDFYGRVTVFDVETGRALARLSSAVGGWDVWLADGRWSEGVDPL